MSEPVTADPTDDDTDLPPLQGNQPDREPPVRPNPYMGGGEPPA
jgi:hypothetical protein